MTTTEALQRKKLTWIYKYEQDGIHPILEVGKEKRKYQFQLYNPVDCIYLFCKVEVSDDDLGEFEVVDTYPLEIPGDSEHPNMSMDISNESGSPFVYIVVKNDFGEEIMEENFLVGSWNLYEENTASEDDISAPVGFPDDIACQDDDSNAEDMLERSLRQLDEMPGLSEIKKEIEKLVECVRLDQMRKKRGLPSLDISHHLVFTGNPGTGKTTVARLLGDIYSALGIISSNKVIETDRSNLVVGYIGQTAITTKEVIDSARGGILYIDEAYTLAKDGNDFGQEAIDTLLKCMEDYRDDLVVVVAGYPVQMSKFIYSNPGLKSRFKTFINFKDYTGEELYEIFELMCQKHDMKVEEEAIVHLKEYFQRMAKNKNPQFANGREVRNFFEEVIGRQAHRLSKGNRMTKSVLSIIKMEDLGIEDNRKIGSEALRELMSMTGLKGVKAEVRDLLYLVKNQRVREEKGLASEKISHHMVFTGNPGTGKTTVARILARIYKSIGVIAEDKLVEVDSSMLVAGYIGQTAMKTKDVINSALGGVLFIDEAYVLERSAGGFGQEAIDTLLKAMEDYRDNLVVIVAGYDREMKMFIDSNPGLKSRFNNYIHFQDYSSSELFQILQDYCKKEEYKLEESAGNLLREYINAHTDLFSGNGRDVRNLFEKLKKQQASRVGCDKTDIEELITITDEDVSALFIRQNKEWSVRKFN